MVDTDAIRRKGRLRKIREEPFYDLTEAPCLVRLSVGAGWPKLYIPGVDGVGHKLPNKVIVSGFFLIGHPPLF